MTDLICFDNNQCEFCGEVYILPSYYGKYKFCKDCHFFATMIDEYIEGRD